MSSPSRILYVDDDKDSSELARVLLDFSGVECSLISAETAREGLLLILKEKFDLYIFDYRMPEISGIELCRCVRQFDSETPILFYSAMARPADIALAREAGANDYLIKPNDLENLSVTAKRLLDESSLNRSRQSIIETKVDIPIQAPSEQVLRLSNLHHLPWKDVFQKSIIKPLKALSKTFPRVYNRMSGMEYNQDQLQTNLANKLHIRPLLMGTAIFAVLLVHFVFQIAFFQSENLLSRQNSPKIENELSVETKTQDEQNVKPEIHYTLKNDEKTSNTEVVTDKFKQSFPSKTRIVPSRGVIKKQERQVSRAERLRRAERILTGV